MTGRFFVLILFAAIAGGLDVEAGDLDKVRSYRELRQLPGYHAVYVAAFRHGLDPSLALAVARVESHGRCRERSPRGARGVMQVKVATAKRHIRKGNLFDCAVGAKAGIMELKRLLVLTKGNRRKALIAYNCGQRCLRYKHLPRETKRYLKKVLRK